MAVIVGLLAVVLVVKSLAVFMAAVEIRQVVETRRMVPAGSHLTDDALVAELPALAAALFWTPGDADLHSQYGRDLHRLAVTGIVLPPSLLRDLAARFRMPANTESRILLLTGAIRSYEAAVRANALVPGARVWRVAAVVARDGADRQRWDRELRAEMQAALFYDPEEPGLWRTAGGLALDHGDTRSAVAWYQHSLQRQLDGLEEIAERLTLMVDGERLLAEAIPHTPAALRRLARWQFDAWRFADAQRTWTEALRLAKTTPLWASDGEAVLDGDFGEDESRLLHPWVVAPLAGVTVERRAAGVERFVSILFNRGVDNWYHVTQQVPVEPGRRYRLSARVRVQGFAPEDRLGVEAVHPYAAEFFAAVALCQAATTERSNGIPVSNGQWVTVSTDLMVPPNLHLLSIRLRRAGTASGTGQVDFASVSLRRLEN